MKTNMYKVVVKLKELEDLQGTTNNTKYYNTQAYSAMDAHKQIHDKIDWRLQEISVIECAHDNSVVYTLEEGFLGEG